MLGIMGNSLAVQWLGFCASTEGDTGLIPGQGTKIPQATRHSQKKKKLEIIVILININIHRKIVVIIKLQNHWGH